MKDVLPVIWLVGAILALIGCHKQTQETSTKNTATATIAATNEAITSEINQTTQPLEGPADPGMTEQLRTFIREHGRLPADFAEFSRARLDSVPRVPQGMKWAIDPATQEVKLVKQ
jgi:hypothetical protein